MTLDHLLAQVAQARRGDHTLGERLYPDFLSLSVDTQLSPEMQTLYKVLVRILIGINNPDLSALPAEWAEAIQTVIKQLQK